MSHLIKEELELISEMRALQRKQAASQDMIELTATAGWKTTVANLIDTETNLIKQIVKLAGEPEDTKLKELKTAAYLDAVRLIPSIVLGVPVFDEKDGTRLTELLRVADMNGLREKIARIISPKKESL